jgi:hypothetical protein
MNKKYLIIAENNKSTYSGGRYCAWILAQSLIAGGNKVDYWTNTLPYFTFDFDNRTYQDRINMDLSLFYKPFKYGQYDFIILIPGGDPNNKIYEKAILASFYNKSKLVLLNFETPNWFNSLSPVKKDEILWDGWKLVAKYSSLILSISNESNKFAKDYYNVNKVCQFRFSSPSINSNRVGNLKNTEKKNQIIIITRFDKNSIHKGGLDILKLFDKRINNFKFIFIIGGHIDSKIKNIILERASQTNTEIEFLLKLNDNKKFNIIKESKWMVFLSKFEGLGYPPIEALYCQTRCIAYKLPVFVETCENHIDYIDHDDYERIINIVSKPYSHLSQNEIRSIQNKFSFENYTKSLNSIFDDCKYEYINIRLNQKFIFLIKYFFNYFISLASYLKISLFNKMPISIKNLLKKYLLK